MCPAKEYTPEQQDGSVLVISGCQGDSCALDPIIRKAGWNFRQVRNHRDAMGLISAGSVHVVIVSTDFEDTDWRDVLSEINRLPHPPLLIVTSRTADDYLWADVLNRGGYDVLVQPFDAEEVRRVITSARRHCDRRAVSASLSSKPSVA